MINILKLLPLLFFFIVDYNYAENKINQVNLKNIVDHTIQPLLQKNNIPGIAIAITVDGKNYFYNYGVSSKETRQPISSDTIFEIGSLSKTFTATIACYAQNNAKLSLSDAVSDHLPFLRGTSFDQISLLNLGTHTASLPLFVPETINTQDQLMTYLKQWQSQHLPGTHRIYSNIGSGLLGMIAAKSMHKPYAEILEKQFFPALGMRHSYLHLPLTKMKNYAQGYTQQDEPVRLSDGVFAEEAYGIKSSTADLIRFINAHLHTLKIDKKWQSAMADTLTTYYKSGEIDQDLMWEQYPYPVDLKSVLAGNAATYLDLETKKFDPPRIPQTHAWINKTGSTNGFAAYITFIPMKKIGMVMLANKNYAIDQRVIATYQILSQIENLTHP